jgi:hypothetical protein
MASIVYPKQAEESIITSGMIVMWSGSIASIPDGWVLCNGTNGTPDLRDKFVAAAKQDDGGVAKTNISGGLTQTGGAATHTHTDHNNHTVTQPGNHNNIYTDVPSATIAVTTGVATYASAQNHLHQIANLTHAGMAVDAHSDHDTVSLLNPYYALAFIMKT